MKKTYRYIKHPSVRAIHESPLQIIWSNIARRKIMLFSVIFLIITLPIFFLVTKYQSKVQAAWMNDSWAYRTGLTIGNTGSADSDKKVKFDIDTATLITAGKMQADCGDSRFTDINGRALKYFIDTAGGTCNTNSTDYYVLTPTINSGNTVLYHYYGNPSAQNGTVSAQFSQATFSPTSGPSAGSEENGTAPISYWKFDEGYGTNANDSTQNAKNGTLTGVPEWKPESECISGKCLFLDGTNTDYVSISDSGTTDPLDLGTKSFTVSYWGKAIDYTYPKSLFPIKDGSAPYTSGAGHEGWSISDNYSSTTVRVAINDGTNMVSSDITLNSGSQPPDLKNKWTHYSFVFDRTNNLVYIYINGIQQNNTLNISSVTGSISNTTALLIGYGTGWKTHGYMDEFKIYPYARTAAQIKSDFASKGSGSVKGTAASLGSNIKNLSSLSDGLVGYWKMDESTTNTCTGGVNDSCDSSGNASNGAWNGNTTSAAGKFGNSTTYDGIDDYTSVTENSAWEFSSSFTLSTWVYSNGTQIAYAGIVAKDLSSSMGNYGFFYDSGGTIVRFGFYGTNSVQSEVDTQTAIPTGQWVHLIGVFDDVNNTLYIYQNGELKEKDTTITNTPSTNDNSLIFGSRQAGLSSYEFNGKIDEARIYNRALSPKEVRDLYSWAPGPAGYWNFDEKTGASVNDISGNGYTGTWNGTGASHWTTGKFGSAGNFNGTDDYISQGTGPTIVNSVSFWTYPTSTTNYFVDLNGSAYISATSGTLSATGFTSPTIYVNGVVSSTLAANQWQYITVTTATNLNASALNFGKISTNYLTGKLDEVRLYNYARTQKQIVEDMNAGHPVGGSPVGSQLGYWKFDEGYGGTANDTVANQNLTITSASWTNSGKFNKALNFDNGVAGSEAYYNDVTSSKYDLTNDFSFGAWVYRTNSPSNQARIISKGDKYLLFTTTNNIPICYMNGLSATSLTATSALPVNQWIYVLCTYKDNARKLYINGILNAQDTPTGTITSDNTDLVVGNYDVPSDSYRFRGIIDEVKIYNSALTSDEIKLDYNHGSAMVLGSVSTDSTGAVADNSSARGYCIPGDTTSCSAPVGEWKMDEKTGTNAYDTSGNGLTGTFTGSPRWRSGKFGSGINFDGGNDWSDLISIPYNSATTFSTNKDITISAWFKSAGSSYTQTIFDSRDGDINWAGIGLFVAGTGEVSYYIRDNAGHFINSATTSTYIDNKWHNATLVGDRDGNAVLYIDGSINVGTTQPMSTIIDITNAQNDMLGNACCSASAWEEFQGSIDQVRLYNYARTPAQIAWDYNRGGPVGWWKMDECQGITANDSSGNGNNGTITIGATGTNTSAGTCTGSAGEAWKDGATGKYNSSLEFDGTDDYINVVDNNSLDMTTNITLSAWIKLSDLTITNANNIVAKGTNGYQFTVGDSSSLKVGLAKQDVAWVVQSNTTISDTNWHFVSVTYNGTTGKVYLDGIDRSGSTSIQTFSNTSDNLFIGSKNPVTATKYFNGQIDDIRVYNYALTANQVKNLYNENSSIRFGPATGSP
ncbi:MAG: hypothetical protein US38_C0014G0003 [Candidatus Roizmanbacteria bacterium GW2011_GWC1_37_12]|nr:MAG: hypothetical protein US38_C0014G0003 [Candidatus Roizmanbacteria bacterium GW2011_GWC1_37_12]